MLSRRSVLVLLSLALIPVLIWGLLPQAPEEEIRIAAAASYRYALPSIVESVTDEHDGPAIRVTYASTGSLKAAIERGAPYDLFLSADLESAQRIESLGLATPQGVVAITTNQVWFVKRTTTEQSSTPFVAIPNPSYAPYGRAAQGWLDLHPEFDPVTLVYADNAAHAATLLRTGAVQSAFVDPGQAAIFEASGGFRVTELHDSSGIQLAGCALNRSAHPLTANRVLSLVQARWDEHSKRPAMLRPDSSATFSIDTEAVALSLRLGLVTAGTIVIFATPLAAWLSSRRSWIGEIGQGLTLLPLALPPTVLGLLLVTLMQPEAPLPQMLDASGLFPRLFSFTGIWLASCLASGPLALQPMLVSFGSIDREVIAAARVCGASWPERFFRITLPLACPGILTGAALAFAHSVGQFGVILMVGGNIPSNTRTASISIYDAVQLAEFGSAWGTSLVLIGLSAVIVFTLLLGAGFARVRNSAA